MTVATQTGRKDYNCNGATTSFPIPFYAELLDNEDLLVYRVTVADGTAALLSEGALADYTITGQDVAGGIPVGNAVETTSAFSASYRLVLLRIVTTDQSVALSDNQSTPMDSIEAGLDLLAMQVQQLQEQLDRTPKFATTSTTSGKTIAEPEEDASLVWDENGNVVNGPASGAITSAVADAEAAQAAAETAQAAAEAAQTAAETAQTGAETAETNAAASATAAATSETNAAASEAAAAGAVTAHEADTTAHPATSITYDPTALGLTSTDVQGIVEEVVGAMDDALSTHEGETTGVHGIADTADLVTKSGAQTLTGIKSLDTELVLKKVTSASVASPAAGYDAVFVDSSDSSLKAKNSSGTVRALGGGGGGGGSIQWIEDTDSPVPSVENSNQIYAFGSGLSQKLYALIRVPNGYLAGSQINLRTVWYSADSSNTALISTVATLIRTGTDVITSTTNQRTSTNAAVTMSGSTQNKPQALVCDLTSSSGQINSVSVSAGDLILVQLTRGSDSGTSDIKVPVYGTEVTFA